MSVNEKKDISSGSYQNGLNIPTCPDCQRQARFPGVDVIKVDDETYKLGIPYPATLVTLKCKHCGNVWTAAKYVYPGE